MIRFLDDVAESIRSEPGRTGLSLLAIAIGIFALTLLVAMLTGLEQRAERMIRELGLHVVGVTTSSASPNQTPLRREHVELLRGNLPGDLVSGIRFDEARGPNNAGTVKILASDPELLAVRNWQVADGRFVDDLDVIRGQAHCVVSAAHAKEIVWRLGSTLPISKTYVTVVGSLGEDAVAANASELEDERLVYGSHFVIVPHSLEPTWREKKRDPAEVDILFVKGRGDRAPSEMTREIEDLLGLEAKLPPRQYITSDTLVANVRRLQRTIQLTTGSVALLCLLLGGITMMSLMIANVKERVPEIGLRRALGASRLSVCALFIFEGMVVTLVAGVIGIAAAVFTVDRIAAQVQLPVALTWSGLVLPAAVALVLGVVFTLLPARLAAGISPSEALRAE